jgi:hypothetical protein
VALTGFDSENQLIYGLGLIALGLESASNSELAALSVGNHQKKDSSAA